MKTRVLDSLTLAKLVVKHIEGKSQEGSEKPTWLAGVNRWRNDVVVGKTNKYY